MSSAADFVLEWNKVFQFKISESCLLKPTEQFLFDALKNYLENKNINVEKIMDVSNNNNDNNKSLFSN